MRTRIRRTGTLAVAIALIISLSQALGVSAGQADLAAVRAATVQYHDVANAQAAGYGLLPAGVPLHECIMALDGSGGMGFHFINGNLLDAELDAAHPESVIYAPDRQGRLRLVAVEYVVFEADWFAAHGSTWPELLGQPLTLVPAGNRYDIPAFYELHAWIWQGNPAGTFTDFNPNVSCG